MLLLSSRNAVYVNEERVGKSNTAVLKANDTIHFTKPGLNTRTISPTVYKFEILYVFIMYILICCVYVDCGAVKEDQLIFNYLWVYHFVTVRTGSRKRTRGFAMLKRRWRARPTHSQ